MHAILALFVLAPATALAAPVLTIEGACPGVMTVTVSGLTPGGSWGLAHDDAVGPGIVGSGPCAGTFSALADHHFAIGGPDRGSDGVVTFTPDVPAHVCASHYLEFLDISTCEVSNAALVGAPELGGALIAGAGSGGESGLYNIDLASGAVTLIGDPGHSYTGLDFGDDGTLYGISSTQDAYYTETNGEIYSIDPTTGDSTYVYGTGQSETSLAVWAGSFYAVDQNTEYAVIDIATGAATYGYGDVTPALEDGAYCDYYDYDCVEPTGYGYAQAWDGWGTNYYANSESLGYIDADGEYWFLSGITGMDAGYDWGSAGGAATFHDGQLYMTQQDDGLGITYLFTVDTVTGVATDTGITIESGAIDALTSSTP